MGRRDRKAWGATLAVAWLAAAGTAVAAPDVPEVKQSAQVDTMTIGGDLRVREEYFDFRDAPSATSFYAPAAFKKDRARERFRLRVKAEYKLKDDVTAVAAFASGTGEAVSTNQTFGGLGQQKAIWIDLAYAMWTPGFLGDDGSLKLQAGRMVNPVWRLYTSDVVWDNDFNPEGFSQSASYLFGGAVNVFANAMQMAVNESANTERDPWELTEQIGLEVPLPLDMRLMAAVAKHTWHDEGSVATFGSNPVQLGNVRTSANSWAAAGILRNEYDVNEVTGQLSAWIPVPVVEVNLPLLVQGTLITNPAARSPQFSGSITGGWVKDDGKTFIAKSQEGYQIGAQLGKASAPNSWEVAYYYKRVTWDATVADVADSDFGEGGLNRKGNIAWISYTPNGFVVATLKVFNVALLDKRYVRTSLTSAPAADRGKVNVPDTINRIQADLKVKF